jgi:hypothetical protein
MASVPVGGRVGAILSAEEETVYLLGYGVYQGRHVPPAGSGVKLFGREMHLPNPCIELDSGAKVYGCECWWGPEEKIKAQVAKYGNVVNVDIHEERAKYAPEKNA